MEFDDMDHMPEWEHFSRFGRDDESEENLSPYQVKKNRQKIKCARDLYNQARSLYKFAALFCETLSGEMSEITASLIMQNAMMLCPKIIGAEGADIYILRMENASQIRTNCREMETQVKAADMFKICNPEYKNIVLNEIEKLKLFFIEWVKNFEKDDFKDDWGLY